jgi:hypothetical protein
MEKYSYPISKNNKISNKNKNKNETNKNKKQMPCHLSNPHRDVDDEYRGEGTGCAHRS